MKPYAVALVLILTAAAASCGPLDYFFGVNAPDAVSPGAPGQPPVTAPPGSAPAEQVGGLLGIFFPWAAAAAGALTSAYQEFRKRQYLKSVQALITGIQDVRDSKGPDDLILEPDMMKLISDAQDSAGVRKFVQAQVKALKIDSIIEGKPTA